MGRAASCLSLVALSALTACPVDPGACVPKDGALCVRVSADRAALAQAAADGYEVEVRRGADCALLDQPPSSTDRFTAECYDPVPGCRRLRKSGAVSELPRLGADGTFTVQVELGADAAGPADVIIALKRGGDCLQAGALHLLKTPESEATLTLKGGCADWHRPCRLPPAGVDPGDPRGLAGVPLDHVACGGVAQAGLCCRDRCVPPPAPPVPGMSFIPAGELTLGDPSSADVNDPNFACRKGQVPGGELLRYRIGQPFFLDTREASLADYQSCAGCATLPGANDPNPKAVKCNSRQADGARAANCLTTKQAEDYCTFRTKGQGGLPREIEWEWAAGRGQSRFPWGSDGGQDPATCARVNAKVGPTGGDGQPGLCASDMSWPAGPPGEAAFADRTPEAAPWPTPPLLGMGGNVAEWVADFDTLTGTRGCPPVDGTPVVTSGMTRVLRGGSWGSAAAFIRSTARRRLLATEDGQKMQDFYPELGVRCAWRFPLN